MFYELRYRNNQGRKDSRKKVASPERRKSATEANGSDDMRVRGSHQSFFPRERSRRELSKSAGVLPVLEAGRGSARKVTFGVQPCDDSKNLKEICKMEMVIKLPVKSAKMATRGSQTDYRESEAQTEPWRHEIKADKRLLAEFLALDSLFLDGYHPLGAREVMQIENIRQKLAWENILAGLRGKENDTIRRLLISKISAVETALKEKICDDVNEERMNASKNLMAVQRQSWESHLSSRLDKLYRNRRKENDQKIRDWKHQLFRQLRRMQRQRVQSAIVRKAWKSSQTGRPSESNFEGKSHEVDVIRSKYLEKLNGLTLLERHLTNNLQRNVNKFDYEEASKPRKTGMCSKRERSEDFRETHKSQVDDCLEDDDNSRRGATLSLKIPVQMSTSEPPTPKRERADSVLDEELNEASILLVKIVKGREIQKKKGL